MKRVVFVCSGNTCRSPLAEAILRARHADVEVASAGLVAADGSPAAEAARSVAKERGLDLSGHRSQGLRADLPPEAIVLTMTRSLAQEARRRLADSADRILSVGEYAGRPDEDIPDPIGLGAQAYRATADRIDALLQSAQERHGWLYLKTVGLGSDHAGLPLKRELVAALRQEGIPVRDYGTDSAESCDYPDFAQVVAQAVASGEMGAGVLVCGTGIGMSIAANKVPGARAALVYEGFGATLSRLHNDANIICLGARTLGPALAQEAMLRFLRTGFEGGRHARRVDKIQRMDAGTL